MIVNKRLLLRSKPYDNECFVGFILRLTELNDYDNPCWITQKAEIGYITRGKQSSAVSHAPLDLTGLAELADVKVAKLEALRYPVDPQSSSTLTRLFYNQPVPQYLIRTNRPKVCPRCLSEESYIRRIWDFALVTTCPIHMCKLLDECPVCNKPITWLRNKVSECPCGADWRKHNPPEINESELYVTKQIHLLCHLQADNIDAEFSDLREFNPLYKINLRYFVSALVFVASQLVNIEYKRGKSLIDTKGKNFAFAKQNGEIHELLCNGRVVFDEWPNNYFQFLEWRRFHVPKRRFVSGLDGDFSEYKSALYYQLSDPQLDFMRTAFEEYILTNWDGGYVSHVRRFSPDARMRSKYVSKSQAKEILRMSTEAIERLINSGKLIAVVRESNNQKMILIERSGIEEFKRQLEELLYLKQVKKILGVSSQRIFELVDSGLLNPLQLQEVDERSELRFSKEEIENLLIAVKGKLIRRSPAGSKETISLLMTLRQLWRVKAGIGQLIKAILDERISPYGLNSKPGLTALIFSRKQVLGYVKEQRQIQIGETFSVAEAAKLLGIALDSAQFLIRKGIIQKASVKNVYGWRISKSAIDIFNSIYVMPSKIVRRFGTTSARLTNLLISHGINPISGPKIDGGVQYVFKRVDIEQTDLKKLWQSSKQNHISRLNERKLINAQQAAQLLDVDQSCVLDLVKRGILNQHRHVPVDRRKADGPFFSMFTIEKYKGRISKYDGLISRKVAAEMIGVSVQTIGKYIPGEMIKIDWDGGKRSEYFFHFDDVKTFIEDKNNLRMQTVNTPEAAAICKVSTESIHEWIMAGLLKPVSGPTVDGRRHNLYLRTDIEKLHAERETFKAKQLAVGKSARFGRPSGPNLQPVRDKVRGRIEHLVQLWSAEPQNHRISGQTLRRQLAKEGYRVGINTIYVCLRDLRRKANIH